MGKDPNFSPTGRFVAARRVSDSQLEIVDLVSGTSVPFAQEFTYGSIGLLAWMRKDSYAIFMGNSYHDVEVINAVVDDGVVLQEGNDCTACNPWGKFPVVVDVDHGWHLLVTTGECASVDLTDRAKRVTDASPLGDDDLRTACRAQKICARITGRVTSIRRRSGISAKS